MPNRKPNRIPLPPNDGRSYKFSGGKHVAVGNRQRPIEPASARRARRETEAKAQSTKSAKRGTKE